MIDDPAVVADALLAGPWHPEPMRIRLTRLAGAILCPPWVAQRVVAVLARHPQPPTRADLITTLAALPRVEPELDLARLLDLDAGELAWFADVRSWERRSPSPLCHYRWWPVAKRGGVRLVAAPKPRLKEIQRRLLRHVLAPIPLHDAAHGSVRGRSVRTAVLPHSGATTVIRCDIEGFFAAISARRVFGVLRATGLAHETAVIVTGLCTTVVPLAVWRDVPRPTDPSALAAYCRQREQLRRPHLPQGAPTSPAMANVLAFALDRRLAGLADRFGARYTRYVDDLTFSGGNRLRAGRSAFVDAVRDIAQDEGFRLAEQKTVVLGDSGRQSVLGAVVNDHPALPRQERDRLRAIVHNCLVHGPASQARGRDDFRAHLLGRIAAAGALDPGFGAALRERFDRIDWS